jgi:nucleotide-binding universal stress UspA family protein
MVRFGDPVREIIDVVKDEHVDFVAMATQGWTGVRRFVLDSAAD